MNRILSIAALAACLCLTARSAAEDAKPPSDKCPKGHHTVTVETTKTVEVKPGGVGGGMTRTEKYEVCRPIQNSNLKEFPKKR